MPDLQIGHLTVYKLGIRKLLVKRKDKWYVVKRQFSGDTEDGINIETRKEVSKEIAERLLKAPRTVEV